MNSRPILIDETLKEITEHGSARLPMSMEEQVVSDRGCAYVKHWHNEIQITLVTKGDVHFRTEVGDFLLNEGEGIFFNSGCMHQAIPTGRNDSTYVCVNFDPKVVYGSHESLLRQMYVTPVIFSSELRAVPLCKASWHKEICRDMKTLSMIDRAHSYGYEVLMYSLILHMWYLIVANNKKLLERMVSISFSDKQRIDRLISYIHSNYTENISLDEIAASDHISKGECCRVFKRVLGITPFNYLIRHRVRESVKLLVHSDFNISEVAQRVGFGSSSYFAACFKKEMEMSPISYRKKVGSDKKQKN